jgi:hypothetical protein
VRLQTRGLALRMAGFLFLLSIRCFAFDVTDVKSVDQLQLMNESELAREASSTCFEMAVAFSSPTEPPQDVWKARRSAGSIRNSLEK